MPHSQRAIQLLDPRNYTVAQQNAWLKSEVSLLRRDIERLWKEVEHLETDNISMLTDMYDERMMDIKRSRYVAALQSRYVAALRHCSARAKHRAQSISLKMPHAT